MPADPAPRRRHSQSRRADPPPEWQVPPQLAAHPLHIALKPLTRSARAAPMSGDYHFAQSLADAFLRLGHPVRIDTMDHWPSPKGSAPADIDLSLQGAAFSPTPGVPLVIWLIYPDRPDTDLRATQAAAHVFVASRPALRQYRAANLLPRASLLHQAFDAHRMFPTANPNTPRDGIAFVASNYFAGKGRRLMADLAHATDTPLRLFGRWWQDHPIHRHLQADFIDNRALGDLYRSSEVVLCDHRPSMQTAGFASNRLFDALACAAPLICDPIRGIPRDMRPFIHHAATPDDFRRALATIRAEPPAQRAARHAFAQTMAATHSFDARATQMLPVLLQAAGRA